jgi:hypothetical protein
MPNSYGSINLSIRASYVLDIINSNVTKCPGFINSAIAQRHPRLHVCVETLGGHFELINYTVLCNDIIDVRFAAKTTKISLKFAAAIEHYTVVGASFLLSHCV